MKISTKIQIIKERGSTIVCIASGGIVAGIVLGIINSSDINWSMLLNAKINSFINWTITIPIWVIILSLISIYIVKRVYSYVIRNGLLNYNEDIIDNIKWTFSYQHSKNGPFISNLKPSCTECGTELSINRLKSYYCPSCKKKFVLVREESDIKKIIEQRIKDKSGIFSSLYHIMKQ